MNRYHLFYTDNFSFLGGWADHHDSSNLIEELEESFKKVRKSGMYHGEIIDLETEEIIKEFYGKA